MRIATTILRNGLAMTGQFSLTRRFRQNREALPLLGEVPSAHTGERGRRGRMRCRREKTERSADHSFPHWHSLSPGDPSVSLTLDSAPKRGAKGVDSPLREALPLLGEVPSAHTGERGLRSKLRRRAEKTGRAPTILFPLGTPTAPTIPLAPTPATKSSPVSLLRYRTAFT